MIISHHYLVVADRLSGWTEQCQIKSGTHEAGSKGLITALRNIFRTFGVPIQISSDGSPEFTAVETKSFLTQWGVHHRISSAYLPSSNGCAELAVKNTKRLLMDNTGINGNLDNDKIMRALLMQRNTPEPGCKLSPAEILFGRQLRDTLPSINKDISTFENPQIHLQWRDVWRLKEEAMRARYVKTLEKLNEHTKSLPPLQIGDLVYVQNKEGRFPTKWNRSGTIVAVQNFDQYLVKIDGTGRVTLRNRRFLRRYEPHSHQILKAPDYQLQAKSKTFNNPSAQKQIHPPDLPAYITPTGVTDEKAANLPTCTNNETTTDTTSTTMEPFEEDHPKTPIILSKPSTPHKSQSDLPLTTVDKVITEPQQNLNEHRRSSRSRTAKKFYDPSSGTYAHQNP